jgi:hypothetical protein
VSDKDCDRGRPIGRNDDDGTADAIRAFAGGSGGNGKSGRVFDALRLGGGNGALLGEAARSGRPEELVPGRMKAGSGR